MTLITHPLDEKQRTIRETPTTSRSKKCSECSTCSEKASEEFDETYRGEYFEKVILPKICEVHKKEIMKKWKKLDDPGILLTPTDQKHEKIEKMAWELFKMIYPSWFTYESECLENMNGEELGRHTFNAAEIFYALAKEKQEEANDGKS